MLKIILIALAVMLVVFVIVVALQPAQFRVSRSAVIPAPPAVVFAHVNDLHRWEAWSPWAKMDPRMTQTYEGPPTGPGSVSRWVGNTHVGEGSMTIIDSQPHERVGIRLQFIRPFASTNAVDFTFAPQGEGTAVTWNMTGQNNFMAKAIGLFMNMDRLVGGQFDEGLANLSAVSVAAHQAPSAQLPERS